MKNLIPLLFLLSVMFACNRAGNPDTNEQGKATEVAALKTIELHVTGMTCEGCEHSVETALTGVNGVVTAKASHQKEVTVISYDTTKVKPELLAETINNLGYHVEN
jgi:copper chaperone CopZ